MSSRKKRIQHSPSLFLMAIVFIAIDAAVSGHSIHNKLSSAGETGAALAFAIVLSVLLFLISLNAFRKGLELSEEAHTKKRSINLGILGSFIAVLATISFLMNAWAIGEDSMRLDWFDQQLHERITQTKRVNTLFKLPEDNKATLNSIEATTTKWLTCERLTGCVGKEGGGDGQVSIALSGYLSITQNAINELIELGNEYEPLIEDINDVIDKISFIEDMDQLSFDEKLARAQDEIQKLALLSNKLQNLLPVRTFSTLAKEFDTSVNQYEAQGISPVGSRTLFNFYDKHGKQFSSVSKSLERGTFINIAPIETPSDLEVMTASSNALFIWLISAVLAFSGWLMLIIHIIQHSYTPSVDGEDRESSRQQVFDKQSTSTNDTESFSAIQSHTKH